MNAISSIPICVPGFFKQLIFMLNCSVPFKSAGTVAFIISPFSGESSGFKSIVEHRYGGGEDSEN